MFIVRSYSGSIGDFESFGGGPTPSRTTKDVKVQFLRSRVNCANKLNHFYPRTIADWYQAGALIRSYV